MFHICQKESAGLFFMNRNIQIRIRILKIKIKNSTGKQKKKLFSEKEPETGCWMLDVCVWVWELRA
jgi:hypothetical protein